MREALVRHQRRHVRRRGAHDVEIVLGDVRHLRQLHHAEVLAGGAERNEEMVGKGDDLRRQLAVEDLGSDHLLRLGGEAQRRLARLAQIDRAGAEGSVADEGVQNHAAGVAARLLDSLEIVEKVGETAGQGHA